MNTVLFQVLFKAELKTIRILQIDSQEGAPDFNRPETLSDLNPILHPSPILIPIRHSESMFLNLVSNFASELQGPF